MTPPVARAAIPQVAACEIVMPSMIKVSLVAPRVGHRPFLGFGFTSFNDLMACGNKYRAKCGERDDKPVGKRKPLARTITPNTATSTTLDFNASRTVTGP